MTDPTIRHSTIDDINGINSLLEKTFGAATDNQELLWLLSDQESPSELNSKVISIDGAIEGHVGYVKSTYLVNQQAISGIHATNLAAGKLPVRGMGRKMFEQVSYVPDVAILYEGTPSAIKMYPKSGYKIIGYSELYSTTVKYPNFSALKSPSFKAFLKKLIIPLRDKFKRLGKNLNTSNDITFETLKPNDDIVHAPLDSALTNTPDWNKINWLNKCPFLESCIYVVKLKENPIGILYLYINNRSEFKTARIVCMPNVGGNSLYWQTILNFAEKKFRESNVIRYTIYASHPSLREVLSTKGFIKEHDRNIWCYDSKGLLNGFDLHLMHLEGDHAFREV